MSSAKRALRRLGVRRSRLAAVRMCCERHMLAAFPARRTAPAAGRILCYHSVGTPEWGVNDVSPKRFRRHIELALQRGHRFVPAEHIARTGGKPGDLAITFDDGLRSVAVNAAPVLAEYSIPWTLFVVSDWAEGRHSWRSDTMLDWRDIERLAASGATIGSHSVTHPDFGRLDAARILDELGSSRKIIARRTGIDPRTFAIPFGQSDNWTEEAAEAARAVGYEIVYAQSVERRPVGTVARTFVTRFDGDRIFGAALRGSFDGWEEWL